MSKLRFDKKVVATAVVEVDDSVSSGEFNHGRIKLYFEAAEMDSYSLAFQASFQRHALDQRYSMGIRNPDKTAEQLKNDLPPGAFDFGRRSWCRFYGGHVDMKNQFDLNYGGTVRLERASKIIKKINATIQEFNLGHVTGDELWQWVEALKKLGVTIVLRRWIGSTKYEDGDPLPNDLQAPAYQLYRNRQEEEREAEKNKVVEISG